MEQEYHSELFDIRRVSENDKELFREVAKAEYLFGRLYDVEPDIGLKVYWEKRIMAQQIKLQQIMQWGYVLPLLMERL